MGDVMGEKAYVESKKNTQQIDELMNKSWTDFMTPVSSAYPWIGGGVGTGTGDNGGVIDPIHPGVVRYLSAASSNTGYYEMVRSYQITLKGSEKTTFVFQTGSAQTTVTRRMGFFNVTDTSQPPTGVHVDIVSGILTGRTSKSGTSSTTKTSYNLSNGTWYRLVIEINSNASSVTYTLYADNSYTILWTDTLSTNIPAPANGWMNHGDLAFSSGTTAIPIGALDYVDLILPNRRIVR